MKPMFCLYFSVTGLLRCINPWRISLIHQSQSTVSVNPLLLATNQISIPNCKERHHLFNKRFQETYSLFRSNSVELRQHLEVSGQGNKAVLPPISNVYSIKFFVTNQHLLIGTSYNYWEHLYSLVILHKVCVAVIYPPNKDNQPHIGQSHTVTWSVLCYISREPAII